MLEKLAVYGADVKSAMNRLVNDEPLYIECINCFLEDESFAALYESVARGDAHYAFERAHTLKGVCANLSLTPLYESICAVVEPLRNGELKDVEAGCRRIEAERQRLAAVMGVDSKE